MSTTCHTTNAKHSFACPQPLVVHRDFYKSNLFFATHHRTNLFLSHRIYQIIYHHPLFFSIMSLVDVRALAKKLHQNTENFPDDATFKLFLETVIVPELFTSVTKDNAHILASEVTDASKELVQAVGSERYQVLASLVYGRVKALNQEAASVSLPSVPPVFPGGMVYPGSSGFPTGHGYPGAAGYFNPGFFFPGFSQASPGFPSGCTGTVFSGQAFPNVNFGSAQFQGGHQSFPASQGLSLTNSVSGSSSANARPVNSLPKNTPPSDPVDLGVAASPSSVRAPVRQVVARQGQTACSVSAVSVDSDLTTETYKIKWINDGTPVASYENDAIMRIGSNKAISAPTGFKVRNCTEGNCGRRVRYIPSPGGLWQAQESTLKKHCEHNHVIEIPFPLSHQMMFLTVASPGISSIISNPCFLIYPKNSGPHTIWHFPCKRFPASVKAKCSTPTLSRNF